jgi:hypothetical protein
MALSVRNRKKVFMVSSRLVALLRPISHASEGRATLVKLLQEEAWINRFWRHGELQACERVGYRADIVDIGEGVAASPENSLPASTVTILAE